MKFTVVDPKLNYSRVMEMSPTVKGGTLLLSTALPKGSRITPESPEEVRALIAHLEDVLKNWEMPEKGKQTLNPNWGNF